MLFFHRALIWIAILCVLFGFSMIVNTNLSMDGGWYWYATVWIQEEVVPVPYASIR
jgi:hypothetical protein